VIKDASSPVEHPASVREVLLASHFHLVGDVHLEGPNIESAPICKDGYSPVEGIEVGGLAGKFQFDIGGEGPGPCVAKRCGLLAGRKVVVVQAPDSPGRNAREPPGELAVKGAKSGHRERLDEKVDVLAEAVPAEEDRNIAGNQGVADAPPGKERAEVQGEPVHGVRPEAHADEAPADLNLRVSTLRLGHGLESPSEDELLVEERRVGVEKGSGGFGEYDLSVGRRLEVRRDAGGGFQRRAPLAPGREPRLSGRETTQPWGTVKRLPRRFPRTW